MKYLFVPLLFLPTCLMAQNKEEKMPGHITKYRTGGCERNREPSSLHQTQGILSQLPDQRLCNEILQRRHRGVLHQPENGKTDLNAYSKEIFTIADSFPKTKASIHGQRQRNLPTLAGREDTY